MPFYNPFYNVNSKNNANSPINNPALVYNSNDPSSSFAATSALAPKPQAIALGNLGVQQEQQQSSAFGSGLEQRKEDVGSSLNIPEVSKTISDVGTNFALTGGYSPVQKEQFLRKATSPINAVYSRANDELNRQKLITGGFNPGFGASQARLTRQKANAGSEASLGANVALNQQVNQNQLAGQQTLQNYLTGGMSALNDLDVLALRNRMQTGQMTQFDATLLQAIASQDKGLFAKITQGLSAIGGFLGGVAPIF